MWKTLKNILSGLFTREETKVLCKVGEIYKLSDYDTYIIITKVEADHYHYRYCTPSGGIKYCRLRTSDIVVPHFFLDHCWIRQDTII